MNYPDAVWAFIEENQTQDTSQLALKLAKQNKSDKNFILQQIKGRQKARQKFPFLLKHTKFLYPNQRAIEQASSELTARYKAKHLNGKRMADLSGGMGIDSFFFAHQFDLVYYNELNPELLATAKHNVELMGLQNIICSQGEAENFIQEKKERFDWIYLDPDRRKKEKKLYRLEDCEPNVIELLPKLFQKSSNLLLKLSPLIDLKQLLKQIDRCYELHIISVKNECKEVLAFVNKSFEGEARVKSIDLSEAEEEAYSFSFSEEASVRVGFHEPLNYLYEPNTAILKAGAFKKIADDYGLYKLAQHTHLYTSKKLVTGFPGRIIKIDWWGKPQKGKCESANVVKRNFPLTAAQIRKKYKIKESRKTYCYACSLNDEKRVFIKGDLLDKAN